MVYSNSGFYAAVLDDVEGNPQYSINGKGSRQNNLCTLIWKHTHILSCLRLVFSGHTVGAQDALAG